jgi:ATP-binding cassette, subfamily B, multidrug efflux pump
LYMNRGGELSYLGKYWSKYWKPFTSAITFLMVEAVCDLLQPTIMAKIVDVGVAEGNLQYVLWMGSIMLGVTAFGATSAILRNFISSKVSQNFGMDLRKDLFRKIQFFSFDIDKFETASLITRLTNDVTQVQNFVHGLMRIFVKAPLLCIGGLVMATLLNPKMAWVLMAVVPIVALIIFASMKTGYPYFTKVQKALDRVNGVMREYLSGVRVVKAFNRFDYEVQRFSKSNEELANASISAMRVMAVFSPFINMTVNISIVAVLWFGGYRVDNGSMQLGQIIAFINYMTQILFSLMMISFVFTNFVRAKASSERIAEVLSERNSIPEVIDPENLDKEKGKVEFENVYFEYRNSSGDPVLKDISFSVAQGETLGIIGPTGSGKTTLVDLIPRFYDAVSGIIKVNGVNIRNVDTRALREKIAIVPQKNVLFTGTIAENIEWGKENASQEDVQYAAEVAQAHSFIAALPEGYNTRLGQGGVNLSGGQKQRISISRALVRQPEILILDDCTSAVDVTTEAMIKKALRVYSKDLTCIIIAQRITSVMDADKIIVLDNGEIAGMGKHEELMDSCRVYQDIFHSQIGREGI